MRVLICPDKFAGTLSATNVADALIAGWRSVSRHDETIAHELADGGPGFLTVLSTAVNGERLAVPTTDPLGRPVTAEILLAARTAYIESAQACGLHLLTPREYDPLRASSRGLGPLVRAAIESGARTVVIGLGGAATNDGGAGLLGALGLVARDRHGRDLLTPSAHAPVSALAEVVSVTMAPLPPHVTLVAATDVDNPLTGPDGASRIFGPQKGLASTDTALVDDALAHFIQVVERDLATCPPGLATLPGAGAAGGLGAAVLALGGRRRSGIELVARLTRLDDVLSAADLVITGEGSFDKQSFHGKVVAGVAAAAKTRRVPCVVVAGRAAVDADLAHGAGVTEWYSLTDHYGGGPTGLARAMSQPAQGLHELGAQLAHRWSRSTALPR